MKGGDYMTNFIQPSYDQQNKLHKILNVTMLNKFNADAVQQRIDECTKIINQESANQ